MEFSGAYFFAMKSTLYTLLISIFVVFFCSCNQPQSNKEAVQKIYGKTMGTTYSILFASHQNPTELKASIDSLLLDFDFVASTYNPESAISAFNNHPKLTTNKGHFLELLERSRIIFHKTKRAFDPTIMPLVSYYNFGSEKIDKTKTSLDSIKALVGFDKISWVYAGDVLTVEKQNPKTQLDFNAIAKGFGVDLVGRLLESKNIENYLVEIGGEMRARGQKPDGSIWKISIDKPEDNQRVRQPYIGIKLKNKSIATSGNYRNFNIIDGKKVGHTINPKTGKPEITNLLSASIIVENCIDADAYATACMVMGLEKSKAFVKEHNLSAMFIFVNDQNEFEVWQTEDIDRLF